MTAYGREEVQLHTLLTLYPCTLCRQTTSWPLFGVLTFLFLHKISLTKNGTGDSSWYPYLCGLLDFSITYPHSLALRRTLALYVCVWSVSHSTCFTLWENAEYQLNRRLDGPEIWPEAWKKWKISWPCQEPNLNYSFIYPGHSLPTTPTALSQLPYCSQSYPAYMCYSCNRLFLQQPLLI